MNKTTTSIIALVLIIIAFYGGMKYEQHVTATTQSARFSQFANGGGRNGRGGFGNGVMGQIISIDPNGFTISVTATSTDATVGSAIVYASASTTINQMNTISLSQLKVGSTVIVNGTKDASGAIEANAVQVRNGR